MDANSEYELYLIKKELQSIIWELDDIANDIRRDEKYRIAQRKLNNIDTKKVTDEYAAAHGSGGGGGHAF